MKGCQARALWLDFCHRYTAVKINTNPRMPPYPKLDGSKEFEKVVASWFRYRRIKSEKFLLCRTASPDVSKLFTPVID
jgi:hypothetical protein